MQASTSVNPPQRGRPATASTHDNDRTVRGCGSAEQTVCAVCQVISDNHHIHYGALACFSCRAFFRRAHSKGTDDPGYKCKKEGKCDVADKNRKKCQRCRYEKCLEAGMKPNQVLNAEQKKVRFRKMLEKKGSAQFQRKRSSNSNLSNQSDNNSSEAEEDTDVIEDQAKKRCSTDDSLLEIATSSPPRRLPRCQSDSQIKPTIKANNAPKKTSLDSRVGGHVSKNPPPLHFDEDIVKSEILSSLESNSPSPLSRHFSQGFSSNIQAFKEILEKSYEQQSSSSNTFPATYLGPCHSSSALTEYNHPQKIGTPFSYFHSIIESYNLASINVADKNHYSRLVSGHLASESIRESEYLKVILAHVHGFIDIFAQNFEPLSRLSSKDRETLLSANIPLYLHFIITRYLAATSGMNQLMWVLPENLMFFVQHDIAQFPLDRIIFGKEFFNKDMMEIYNYMDLCSKLNHLNLVPNQRPYLMALLLFVQMEEMSLENGKQVSLILEDLINTISDVSIINCISREKCEKLFDVLHVIKHFCHTAVFSKENLGLASGTAKHERSHEAGDSTLSCLNREVAMKYTVEEEAWLKIQMSKFAQAFKEVCLGEDLVNEFVMFTYDVPLSKHFIPSEINTFVERSRRVMKMHPEFNELTDREQREIWNENCFKAAALYSVKSESFATGIEQLQFCLGNEDTKDFMNKFSHNLHPKLKKVLVTDWNRTTKAMDSDLLIDYLQLTAKISASVEEQEMFFIIALMILFSGTCAGSTGLSQLEKKYSTIFQRKMAAKGDKSMITKLQSGVGSVSELSTIFQRLHVF